MSPPSQAVAPSAETGWLPVGTAPRDRWVLVKGHDTHDRDLVFVEKAFRNSRDSFWSWRDWRGDSIEGRDGRGNSRSITDWMELPL